MSQEKVDEYKEEKKNRKKLMKKEKFQQRMIFTVTVACIAALVIWFSMALYGNAKQDAAENSAAVTTELDLSMVESYQTQLSNYVDAMESDSSEDTSSEGTESVVSGSSASSSSEEVTAASAE